LDASRGQKVLLEFVRHRSSHCGRRYGQSLRRGAGRQALNIQHIRPRATFSLPIVSNTLRGDLFRSPRSMAQGRMFCRQRGWGRPLCAGIL
jgi:hypothetical protein